jgi:hypothetical protein
VLRRRHLLRTRERSLGLQITVGRVRGAGTKPVVTSHPICLPGGARTPVALLAGRGLCKCKAAEQAVCGVPACRGRGGGDDGRDRGKGRPGPRRHDGEPVPRHTWWGGPVEEGDEQAATIPERAKQ